MTHLQRAADQLKTNSVIQDHYGDVLFKLSRFDDAIAAWTRAPSPATTTRSIGPVDRQEDQDREAKARQEVTSRAAALTLALSVVCASCAAPLVKLPSGRGEPAPDASDVLTAATAACRPVTAISLELSVSGSISGRRVRGRLLAGLTRVGAVRLEAVAPVGQPVFVLTNAFGFAQPGANLLLPRDNRVLERGQFETVLEAVSGVPLEAPVLFACSPAVRRELPSGGTRSATIGASCRSCLQSGSTCTCTVRRTDRGRWRRRCSAERIRAGAPSTEMSSRGCHESSG